MKIGFCGVLFLIFLVMKLANVGSVAAWSWGWVTSPLWIGFFLEVMVDVAVRIYVELEQRKLERKYPAFARLRKGRR